MYAAEMRTFAINYFTGSSSFGRALRYWCMKPPANVASKAAQLADHADQFKLSDHSLIAHGPGSRGPVAVVPNLLCESDLFSYLGLDYVPPHLRHFTDFE